MPEYADLQTLIDIKRDADDAALVVGGAADHGGTGQVPTRLGETIPTLARVIADANAVLDIAKDQAVAAAQAAGVAQFYDTKAAAVAALGGLSEGEVVEVFEDETVAGLRTRYRVESAALVFKVLLSVIDGRITTTDLASVPVPAAMVSFRTSGRSTAGVGACDLVRVGSEPAHPGKQQSQDGSWWEFVKDPRGMDYRAFGTGATGINNAVAFVNAKGGGWVLIPEDVTVSATIAAMSDVWIVASNGVTITLDTAVTNMIDGGTGLSNFGLYGGLWDVNDNAEYFLRAYKCTGRFHLELVNCIGWQKGYRFEAQDGTLVPPRVRNIHMGQASATAAHRAFVTTCTPASGGNLVEGIDVDGYTYRQSAPGAFDENVGGPYTADALTFQGCIGGTVRNVLIVNGGEVGISVSFGCRDLEFHNCKVVGADGNGIFVTGSHWRLDVTPVSGTFTLGETVTGATSGAVAQVEYLPASGIVWVLDSASSMTLFEAGETITGGTSGATATVVTDNYARAIKVNPSCRTVNCGLDAALKLSTVCGLSVTRVRDVGLGGHHTDSTRGVRIALSTGYELGRLTYANNGTDFSAVSTEWLGVGRKIRLNDEADPTKRLAYEISETVKIETAPTTTETVWSYTLANDTLIAIRIKVLVATDTYLHTGNHVFEALFKKDGAAAAAQVGTTMKVVDQFSSAGIYPEFDLTGSVVSVRCVSTSGQSCDWSVGIKARTFAAPIQ